MPQCTIHTPWSDPQVRPVEEGVTLLQALGEQAAHLDTPCGGAGRCGKCLVRAQGALSPADGQERAALGDRLDQGFRLACRAVVRGDVEVWLTEAHRDQRIRTDGALPDFPRDPLFSRCGAAIDIGTTTLAARLYGPGGLLAQASALNPQHTFGADVISRIQASLAGQGPDLARCIAQGLDRLLEEMARQAAISPEDVDTLVITGNTTMLYLLTGRDTTCLSRAPFEADERFGRWAQPGEIALSAAPQARIYLPRCMAAFVGADTTCALLASGMWDREESALLADIGTNGELALRHQGRLLCCSTAAGPVFEGAGISQGMQGGAGAIDHVAWREGAFQVHTIGDQPPRGICGSGILDAVAALLQSGLLDEAGALDLEEDQVALTPQVKLTQRDIRMVQLAKGAICAGIRTLLDLAQVSAGDLARLAIAGGFGSYLNLDSAEAIGLIPAGLAQKGDVLGNAALTGAAMVLLNRAFGPQTTAMADQAHVVELSANPTFMDYYIDSMSF